MKNFGFAGYDYVVHIGTNGKMIEMCAAMGLSSLARMEPYRSYFPHAGLLLTETEELADRILILPTGTAISNIDIKVICEIIRLSVGHGVKIQSLLEAQDKNQQTTCSTPQQPDQP